MNLIPTIQVLWNIGSHFLSIMHLSGYTFRKKGILPLIQEWLLSVASESICICTEYWLTAWSKLGQENMVRFTYCLNMIIAVEWDVKPQTKQNLLQIGIGLSGI